MADEETRDEQFEEVEDAFEEQADEEAAAREPHTADAGGRLDRREDASMLQPTHSDQVAWQSPQIGEASNTPANGRAAAKSSEESSTPDRLMAEHQAQWELLRTRSRARK